MPKDEIANEEPLDLGGPIGDDLRLPKLSHLVAARLRDKIVSGKLKPGSMLLPENQLLPMFKVSRPTLREALRVLEAESLITVGRGMRSGATVLGPSLQKAAEYTNFMLVSEGVTIYDLQEARRFFEPAILRSLGGKALSAATAELRACVEEIRKALEEKRYLDVIAGTDRFHEQLARASGNKTILLLVGMVHSISGDAYSRAVVNDPREHSDALQRNMEKTVTGYDALCKLLEQGKTADAAAFWDRYMERSLDFLKRSKLGAHRLIQSSGNGRTGDGGATASV